MVAGGRGRGTNLCLFHQGLVRPQGNRTKLLPLVCGRCLDIVLRGDAPPAQVEEVLRNNELWADEEAVLP